MCSQLQLRVFPLSIESCTTVSESNLPKSAPTRTKLSQDLHIDPADYPDDVPLLYGLALGNTQPGTKVPTTEKREGTGMAVSNRADDENGGVEGGKREK